MPELALIVEQLLSPVPGGTGRYVRELATSMAANAPDDWTVRPVVAWHRAVRPAEIPGALPPHRLHLDRRTLARCWERGFGPAVDSDPAVTTVHAGTPLAPPRRAVPLVATVHDVVPWTHPETLTPRGVAWHRRAISRLVRDADAIVVPTAAVADELDAIFGVRHRITVIPHGTTRLPSVTPDEAARRARELDLPDRYVAAVGTVEPRKGLDVLLAALARPEHARTALVVVGQTGWGGIDLADLARHAGVPAERVRVLGRIDDAALGVVLSGAEVLVLPSRAEGFGLPILEAMAQGTPAVYSDLPVLREVAGAVGWAAPVGHADALAAALTVALTEVSERRAELADEARRRAAAFSWDQSAASTWGLHLRLLGR